MDWIVRAARPDDYHGMSALFEEIDALHRQHHPEIFRKPEGPPREPEYWQGWFADENVGFFVSERNGEILGFVSGVVKESPPIPIMVPRRYAVVDSISVKREFQGNGIGRALMEFFQEWASSKGATSLDLNVFEFNQDAVRFYERLGFESVSHRMSKAIK